jgi:hypothetical protein
VASHLKRHEESSLLCDGLLRCHVVWQAGVELLLIVVLLLVGLRRR